MSEKVIQSFEIVETDEGFRIEMKGDKEMLRKMLFEGGRPFMPFGRGWRFGGHHEHHEHQHHEHHRHPHEGETFEMEVEPLPEHLRDRLFFRRRFRRGGWKFKRGGYDMGPWWDESGDPDEQQPI